MVLSHNSCIDLINQCNELSKRYWKFNLAKYGYFTSSIEEDNNEGEWEETSPDNPDMDFFAKAEERITKKTVFWSERGIDGIVVSEILRENEWGNKYHKKRINGIGNACDYFKYVYENLKKSGLRRKIKLRKKNFVSFFEKIKINDKEYDSERILTHYL